MKCQGTGCERDAVCAPKINVPATGYVIGEHQHLTAIMSIAVCDEHFRRDFAKMDIQAEGNDSLRKIFEVMARMHGAAAPPPDFTRAWISRVSLTSTEYQMFAKIQGESK